MTLTLQQLSDRAEITDLLSSYCQAQDQNAWQLWEGIFTDDATVHLVGVLPEPLAPAALRGFLEAFNSTRVSGQHSLANVLITVAGETAHAVSELTAVTVSTTDAEGVYRRLRSSSVYSDDFVRTPGGWRLRRRSVGQKYVVDEEVSLPESLLSQLAASADVDWFAAP